MSRSASLVPLAGVLLAACASAPTPATRSPQSPAHPAAPEAVTPPARPELLSETQASPGASYTCPMHPHVTSAAPGACPVCGTPLVAKEPPKDESR